MRRLDFCVTAMITVSVEYFSKYLSGSYLLNYLGLLHSRSWSWQLFRMSVNVWMCPELLNLLQPNWLWWCIIRSWTLSIRQKYWLAIFMQMFILQMPTHKDWFAVLMQMFMLRMPTRKHWLAVSM